MFHNASFAGVPAGIRLNIAAAAAATTKTFARKNAIYLTEYRNERTKSKAQGEQRERERARAIF